MLATIWLIGHSLRRLGEILAPNREFFKMTDLEGMPSYFWLVPSRLKTPVGDDVPYTTKALRQDLLRVRNAWDECQANRDRNAIYTYLTTVFDVVAWWAAENRALDRAHKALRLQRMCPFDGKEPFAAVIRCTADPTKVDKRTRSKWSRALRYALKYRSHSEALDQFIKHKGGINECADRFAKSLGWRRSR
jgi:hypothetical protein